MRRVFFAALIITVFTPLSPSLAGDLPKCRNVAGYEPRPTCQARNQRAQWQAEETARLTAQLVAQAMAAQAAAAEENQEGFTDMVRGVFDGAVSTVSGLFD